MKAEHAAEIRRGILLARLNYPRFDWRLPAAQRFYPRLVLRAWRRTAVSMLVDEQIRSTAPDGIRPNRRSIMTTIQGRPVVQGTVPEIPASTSPSESTVTDQQIRDINTLGALTVPELTEYLDACPTSHVGTLILDAGEVANELRRRAARADDLNSAMRNYLGRMAEIGNTSPTLASSR